MAPLHHPNLVKLYGGCWNEGADKLCIVLEYAHVLDVIKGVIDVEEAAVDQYQIIIEATEGVDPVTQDLCITLKGDEEEHRREFKGFLQEALKM